MKKWFILCLITLVFTVAGFCQDKAKTEAGSSAIPKDVKAKLDEFVKTKTPKPEFNIAFLKDYYYPFLHPQAMDKVYVNLLFTADLDTDVEAMKKAVDEKNALKKAEIDKENEKIKKEENKKAFTPENYPGIFHKFYLRIAQNGKTVHDYYSPMPVGGEKAEYYSCTLDFLDPGVYTIILYIKRADNTKEGINAFDITVPDTTPTKMTTPASKITFSAPSFYRDIRSITLMDNNFSIVKNCFQQGGQAEYRPYLKNEFKKTDEPYLDFVLVGTKNIKEQGQQPKWDITSKMTILKEKNKEIEFAPVKIEIPLFSQQLKFRANVKITTTTTEKGKNVQDKVKEEVKEEIKTLAPGAYTLVVEFKDNIGGGDSKIEIPFTIVE